MKLTLVLMPQGDESERLMFPKKGNTGVANDLENGEYLHKKNYPQALKHVSQNAKKQGDSPEFNTNCCPTLCCMLRGVAGLTPSVEKKLQTGGFLLLSGRRGKEIDVLIT